MFTSTLDVGGGNSVEENITEKPCKKGFSFFVWGL
jgi:hypothetical protein